MNIVGTFFKETARFSYKYSVKRGDKQIEQEQILRSLLRKADQTKFGQKFDFKALIDSKDLKDEFRSKIPLFTYETFYHEWLEKVLNGERNVIWPGKINFFALTSGTTNASSKRVPVSDHMIRQFQKTTIEQIGALHKMDLPTSFFQSSVLTIGGSTKLESVNKYFEGDLSGILQRYKPLVVKPFLKPGIKTSKIKNWNKKMDAIVEKAPSWNIGIIAGVPSWVLLLMERIVTTYNLNTIHDIWPNLKVYLHGGVFLDSYEEKIVNLCGDKIFFLNTYLASEGYFAFQKDPAIPQMELLRNHGVYYEFIEEKYFNQITSLNSIENVPTLTLEEVVQDVNYGLVITTSSGLWRYIIGDVIRFTDTVKYSLDIVGRISHTLSMVGEHVSVDNMLKAINYASKKLGVTVPEFCAYPSKNKDRHYWYIGSNNVIDEKLFEAYLNECLEQINDDYASLRKVLLKSPRVKVLPLQKFYDYMEIKGKIGGQNKFPRVLTREQAVEWEVYLNSLYYERDFDYAILDVEYL
jgi:hypothetical protein